MTKAVRIENADTSNFKVVVETWQKNTDGSPDLLVGTAHIHSHRYLVVKEATS